jgi:simple sugar transport system ATP-binding protein
LRGITKRFPGVVANHDIFLTVKPGTVHAIVGENGAGKSTLMKILYGMQRPTRARSWSTAAPVTFHSPQQAIRSGIGMVHQHFMLADNFTVLENVVLGAEKLAGIGAAARDKIKAISDQYGLGVEPDELMADLGVGDRQRVEILKVLYRGGEDRHPGRADGGARSPGGGGALRQPPRAHPRGPEPSSSSRTKLDEVLSVADAITVIRRGTTVATVDPTSVTARDLATLMVGSELPSPEVRESTVTTTPVLAVDGLTVRALDGRGLIEDITFTIHKGEVAGHRRRRGQRPGRTGRGHHGHCAARPAPSSWTARR